MQAETALQSTQSGRRWPGRAGGVILAILVGIVAAWGSLRLFGQRSMTLGPFDVRAVSSFGRGSTSIDLPPLGRLTADTHTAPLGFTVTLTQLHVDRLTDELRTIGVDGIVDEVKADAEASLRPFLWRLLGVAALGSLVGGFVVFRRRWRLALAAGLAGTLAVGGSLTLAWQTYRPAAFLSPTFSGPVSLAPKLIGPAQNTLDRIDDIRAELSRVLTGAARVYTSFQGSPVGGSDEIRVLHISDIHLSPLGMDFAREIADAWDVDVVLDTGDITSFGTPVEELILSEISTFQQPYLYVRGNHDSLAIEDAIRRIPNARVLDGTATTVDGLQVYGFGDPVFTPDKLTVRNDAQIAAADLAVAPAILAGVRALPRIPDLVAVHDDRMAQDVAGYVPVVASGHFHEASARVVDGTLYLQVGSTGGAGANAFTPQSGVPLSAEVLYFSKDEPHRLIAYDVIEQSPQSGSLTVKRHVVVDEFGELTPSPSPSPTGSLTPVPGPSSGSISGSP